MNDKASNFYWKAYHAACNKHPEFAESPEQGVCVISEEFGELAKEILEKKDGWECRTIIEASHVAVTAIRLMEMMIDELNGKNCKECMFIQVLKDDRYAKCPKHEKMAERR